MTAAELISVMVVGTLCAALLIFVTAMCVSAVKNAGKDKDRKVDL